MLFEMLVEIACTGTFRRPVQPASPSSNTSQASRASSPAPPTVHLSSPNIQNIYPIIASVVQPQALHSQLLPCYKNNDAESTVSTKKKFLF